MFGKVTYKGKTLAWGTAQFEGSDKAIRQENINSDETEKSRMYLSFIRIILRRVN